MRGKRLLFLTFGGLWLLVLVLLLSPVIARIGSQKTMRTWSASPGALGVNRPLTLSLERHVAYMDVLGGYPTYRLLITDGGYAYVHDFNIPSADPKGFLQDCRVVWHSNKVEFIMPDGVILTIPSQAVIQQIGT